MHILYLSQILPYPIDAGAKMRSYFVLRHLAKEHQVTLLTFIRDTDKPEAIAHLKEFCHAIHTIPMHRSPLRDIRFLLQSLLTQQPFLIVRDQVSAMTAKIKELARSQQFDAVHADQLWMAQYALEAGATSPKSKLILDQHNAMYLIPNRMAANESNLLKKLILKREAQVLTTYEADVCRQFDQVVWVTQEDYQAVAALPAPPNSKPIPSVVIPICADPANVQATTPILDQKRITFLGGLHWLPNAEGVLWFAKDIFPQIHAEMPEAILTVIGKSPPAGLDGPGVEVTGYVDSLQPYLDETAVFIVPLLSGGGMRVKILDAWSWGLPVVSTSIGAEGITIVPGKDILIADTLNNFAQAVLQVLKEPDLAQNLRHNGRQTILEKYNWESVYAAWDEIYQDTV